MTRRVERQIALITELRFDNTRQHRLAAPAPPREHVAGRARRFQRHGTCSGSSGRREPALGSHGAACPAAGDHDGGWDERRAVLVGV